MRNILRVALAALTLAGLMQASVTDDYTGLYRYFRDDESIQLNVQEGRLGGWVSSHGLLESDRDTMLDRFFKQAELKGDQVHFVTKSIHGCWLEFSGRVQRGQVPTRGKEGYYELVGTVTEYVTDAENHVSARHREAVFKSMADSNAARAAR